MHGVLISNFTNILLTAYNIQETFVCEIRFAVGKYDLESELEQTASTSLQCRV
jgi:hypothetical protein